MRGRQIPGTNRNKADFAFTVYFTVMALLYTKTYIQLAAQLAILAYVAYDVLFRRHPQLRKVSFRNIKFLFLWFGLFSIWAFMSTQWAYSTMPNSNTLLTLFRIFMIGMALFAYITDYDKAVAVLKSFLYSNVVMTIAALMTTPVSQYGKAGEEGFGTVIGQSRNVFGAVMSYSIILCIIFYQRERFKHGKILAAVFVLALLCSGSRGAMLQLLIIACLYVITMPGMVKKFKYIFGALLIGLVGILLLQNIPYLYDIVWVRFEGLINTVLGIEMEADSSALGRELYKVLAMDMFKERPWMGFGVDGFVCYLRDVKFVNGYYLPPRYSHCNYAEIASCFGLVGLALWYLPVFKVWFSTFKLRKKSANMKMVCILLTSMIILDYARIPWMTHMTMYTYFCLILFYLCAKQQMSRNRYQSEFGSL